MGLHDRDWYHEAIQEQRKTNRRQGATNRTPAKRTTDPVGPIWTEQHLYRRERRKEGYGLWILRVLIWVPTIAFLAYVITELAKNH